jgi:glycerol kinase
MSLIASIDQGTSSSRFLIFDPENGELVDSHQVIYFLLKSNVCIYNVNKHYKLRLKSNKFFRSQVFK